MTGYCMEIVSEGRYVLVDWGLFQGSRSLEALNYRDFDSASERIDAVVLTHAHIDHCGLLPKLVVQGFDGPIFCSAQTAELLEYTFSDAGRIQEFETQRRNQRRARAGEPAFTPIYTGPTRSRRGGRPARFRWRSGSNLRRDSAHDCGMRDTYPP